MAFQQQRLELVTQLCLALASLGAIAPGCIAFATGVPHISQAAVPAQPQQPETQALNASGRNAELPFIGTRLFNFAGGTGTNESIEIATDGTTTVKAIGLYGSALQYSGPFTNPILLDDGRRLRLEGEQIFQSFADKSTARSCRVNQASCPASLRKPLDQ